MPPQWPSVIQTGPHFLQGKMSKLKGYTCLDQGLEELQGIVRAGPCEPASVALQVHWFCLAQQAIFAPLSCLLWDRENVHSLKEIQV